MMAGCASFSEEPVRGGRAQGRSAAQKSQINSASSRTIAEMHPNAPTFGGASFFLPRASFILVMVIRHELLGSLGKSAGDFGEEFLDGLAALLREIPHGHADDRAAAPAQGMLRRQPLRPMIVRSVAHPLDASLFLGQQDRTESASVAYDHLVTGVVHRRSFIDVGSHFHP